jgi:tetratricopeptide (TPR) repeat protein
MRRFNLYFLFISLIFIVTVALSYSNTLDTPFVFDDTQNIKDNPHIRLTGLDIKKITDAGFKSPCPNRPFANISFAMNYYLDWYDVTGYHIVNTAIHFINAILIYLFSYITLLLLSGDASALQKRQRLWQYHIPAFIASLLWLSHPIQTQSVTYIVQRMNSMSVMFYMLSLLFYIYGRLTTTVFKRWLLFIGCIVSWIVSLGSKEIAITLPVIVFLYEWFFFQDLNLGFIKRSFKFWIGPVVIFAIFALFFYLGADPMDKILKGYENRDFSLYERMLTQFRVVVFYISLLFYPHPGRLNLDHDIEVSHSLFDPITTLFSMLLIIGLILFAVITLIRYKKSEADNLKDISRYGLLLSFCILWFFINLALESSIISLEMAFEHRVYLPSVSFFLAISTGVFLFVSRLGRANTKADKPTRMAVFISFLTISLLLVITTYQRNKVWHNALTLWQDCVKKSPNKARPHNNLGHFYMKKGFLNQASSQLEKALNIDPLYVKAHNNLGLVYDKKGLYDKAVAQYQEALRIDPKFIYPYINLGVIYKEKGLLDEAVKEHKKALKINPNIAVIYNNLGEIYREKGMIDRAINECQKALKIDPNFASVFNNLGILYNSKGLLDEAITYYQRALEVNPNHPIAHYNLGTIYFNRGMIDTAIRKYEKAIKLAPDFAMAYYNLGIAYFRKGMIDQAIVALHKTLERLPNYSDAFQTLGLAYHKKGILNEAAINYKKALELDPNNAVLYYRLGNLYLEDGQLDLATAEYQNALSIKSDFMEALNDLGIAYTKMKEYDKAISTLKKKIELKPNIVDAYYNIACIYALQNKKDKATFWLRNAVLKGFNDWKLLSTDSDLENIREDIYYKKLISEH